jgi:hypothetical protein
VIEMSSAFVAGDAGDDKPAVSAMRALLAMTEEAVIDDAREVRACERRVCCGHRCSLVHPWHCGDVDDRFEDAVCE